MSEKAYTKSTIHPYKESNPSTHGHFRETELVYPPFSLPARPFNWTMLRKGRDQEDQNIRRLADRHNIDYDPVREPELPFRTNWVQDAGNQRAIFKTFYKDVIPNNSLVVVYAKQVPFIDETKRVIMGLGFVSSVTEPPEHQRTNEGGLRSILWETMVGHTIRKERSNGFLLPYQEMMEYAETHPDFDIRTVTVFADDDYFEEFSYATEHLSHDAVISVFIQALKALQVVKQCIPGDWQQCIDWTNDRLREVWLDRGPFPGLGAMLSAIGFKYGILMANELRNKIGSGTTYEKCVTDAIRDPKGTFSSNIAASIRKTEQGAFLALADERRSLFWLLSRLSLSVEQANVLFNEEYRGQARIHCSDNEILENPYLLYEGTRGCAVKFQIAIRKVDMAVFPPKEIRDMSPLPSPAALGSENDERRIRAVAISILENEANRGHTVYPQNKLIIDINDLPIQPECRLSSDVFKSIQGFLSDELTLVECADGSIAYQLKRLSKIDDVIRRAIRNTGATSSTLRRESA